MGLKEIKILKDIPFIVIEEDKGLSQNLIKWGNREKAATEFFQDFVGSEDVVLDIGSNLGYYVVQEARICKKVYGIEPVKISFDVLNKNIELNKFGNVETFNIAIGETNGKQFMYSSDSLNLSRIDFVEGFDKTEIDMLTGQDFLKQKVYAKNNLVPNVLRMDVEGYELKILESLKDDFKHFDKFFIEVHHCLIGDKGTHQVLDKLKSFGFNKVYVISTDKSRHGQINCEPVIKEGWVTIDDYLLRCNYYHVTYLFGTKGVN